MLSCLFIFVNASALALLLGADLSYWNHMGLIGLSAVGGYWGLNRLLPDRDPFLFPLAFLLTGWGIVMIERLAPAFAERQSIWLFLSVIALVLTAGLEYPMRWLRNYRYVLLLVGLALLVATILLGRNPSGFGPQLWLGFGEVFFQPSEALKIILIAFLASYLGEQYPLRQAATHMDGPEFSPQILGPIVLMWGLSIVVLVWQQDLGTAVIFFAIFLVLLYVTSGQLWILLSGVLLMLVAGLAAYELFSVVQLRIDVWLEPWPEASTRAYQIVQSLMAFGSGSVFGQGIGQGAPDFIPVVHSDFIFAAIAEEFGLLGVTAIVAAVAIIVARGLLIAIGQYQRPFYSLLAVGISVALGIQSLLIMGGALKLVPLTGVTLPFVSYGGSSLLVCYIMVGLLLRLSTNQKS